MKKSLIFLLISNIFLAIFLQAQPEPLFEQKIPSGWKFRKFDLSSSGHIAIYYLPDLPPEILLKEQHKSLLQIFSPEKNLLQERLLEPGSWFHGFTPGNMVLIASGGEYLLLNLEGKEIMRLKDEYYGEREVVFDLRNREIALSPGSGITSLPVTIFDLNTGKEKFRFGPVQLPENKFRILPGAFFLPIGEDDLYVFGFGNTVRLSRYHSQKDLWKINNIGGNIEKGQFLGDDLLAVSYFDYLDKEKEVAKRGFILINWKTGKIIFRKEGFKQGKQSDDWFQFFSLFQASLSDEDNLCFLRGENMIILPKVQNKKFGWDPLRAQKYRLVFESKNTQINNSQNLAQEIGSTPIMKNKERPPIVRNKYWAEDDGNSLKIYKVQLARVD